MLKLVNDRVTVKFQDCRKASCKQFKCHLGMLKMDDKVEIKMTFRLWQNTLLKV